jgi:hypothetical protein
MILILELHPMANILRQESMLGSDAPHGAEWFSADVPFFGFADFFSHEDFQRRS